MEKTRIYANKLAAISVSKMFKISIIDIKTAELVFREMVSSVVLPGEEGEFSILDFHQSFICCLKDGIIKTDELLPMHINKGIARMERNELSVLVEK